MIESEQKQAQLPAVIRLLRCSKTHRYFKNGGWTEDPNQAEMYRTSWMPATHLHRAGPAQRGTGPASSRRHYRSLLHRGLLE